MHTVTRRVYKGMVGREYDEYVIMYSEGTRPAIIHVGTFADEGFLSTTNVNSTVPYHTTGK